MGHYTGRVSEIRLEVGGQLEVCINCPTEAVPATGQYLLASDTADPMAILGTPLFISEKTQRGFWANPTYPISWGPGTELDLMGPLGYGFNLPRNLQRLGLIAMGETVSRLKPLIHSVAQVHTSITLFTDLSLPRLPAALEVSPLALLKEALDWPDFMALDVPSTQISELRSVFGITDSASLPCPAQVLITTPMPCAGLAKCGACAVHARRGWKFACEDGPVFDLSILQW
ncbi:MAG: hypothetical protein WAV05_00540 [Anaerolineales bacterium]